MTASYPTSVKSFTTKTDNVDDVQAIDVNSLQDEVVAIETGLLGWTDYGATSTVTGWSSYTQKDIYYKRIGKSIFITFSISGSSNSTDARFTLPVAIGSGNPSIGLPIIGRDNNVQISTAIAYIQSGGGSLSLFPTMTGLVGWTASSVKSVSGQVFYQVD